LSWSNQSGDLDVRKHLSYSNREAVVDPVELVDSRLLHFRLEAFGQLPLGSGDHVLLLGLAHRIEEQLCLVDVLIELWPVHPFLDTRHDFGIRFEIALLSGYGWQCFESVRMVSSTVSFAEHRPVTVLLGRGKRADWSVHRDVAEVHTETRDPTAVSRSSLLLGCAH